MSFSRRKFLRTGALVAAAASLPIKSAIARAGAKSDLSLNHTSLDKRLFLSRETFISNLNTRFSFSHPEVPSATLKLIEVTDLTPENGRRSASATGRECFAAVFRGSKDVSLRQETYKVSHASLGTFEMFIVPIGASREGLYEAVFTRLN